MPRPVKAAEIARTSLQSFVQVLFDAFYYVPAATHDYVFHTQDCSYDIPVGIHGPDEYLDSAYCELDVVNDSFCFSLIVPYWLYCDVHFDKLLLSNTSDACCRD